MIGLENIAGFSACVGFLILHLFLQKNIRSSQIRFRSVSLLGLLNHELRASESSELRLYGLILSLLCDSFYSLGLKCVVL